MSWDLNWVSDRFELNKKLWLMWCYIPNFNKIRSFHLTFQLTNTQLKRNPHAEIIQTWCCFLNWRRLRRESSSSNVSPAAIAFAIWTVNLSNPIKNLTLTALAASFASFCAFLFSSIAVALSAFTFKSSAFSSKSRAKRSALTSTSSSSGLDEVCKKTKNILTL